MFYATVGFFSRFFGFKSGVAIYTRPEPIVTSPADAIPAVVRATNLISADIARLPVTVYDSEMQAIADHPVAALMNRDASRWQSGYEFRRYTTAVALTHGNGLAIIKRIIHWLRTHRVVSTSAQGAFTASLGGAACDCKPRMRRAA